MKRVKTPAGLDSTQRLREEKHIFGFVYLLLWFYKDVCDGRTQKYEALKFSNTDGDMRNTPAWDSIIFC